MRVIVPNLMLIISLLFWMGCSFSNKVVPDTDNAPKGDSIFMTEDSIFIESTEDSLVQRDTIVGRFVSDYLDSIWIDETVGPDSYISGVIKSSIKGWTDVVIEYLYRSYLVYEGDLDGDGFDDFGMVYTLGNTNWCNYYIFSIRNNCLYILKDTCRINLSDAVLEDLASPSGKRNKIQLLHAEDVWADPIVKEDWIGWEYKSTLVPTRFVPFE